MPPLRSIPGWTPTPINQPYAPPAPLPEGLEFQLPPELTASELAQAFGDALKSLPDLLPWLYPPRSATPFTLPQVNTPQTLAVGGTLTLIEFQVQQGRHGKIAAFGVNGTDLANLRWSILVRNSPVPPVAGLVVNFGTIAQPTPLPGPGILVGGSDVVTVQVTNIGVAPIDNVQARLDGYTWGNTP